MRRWRPLRGGFQRSSRATTSRAGPSSSCGTSWACRGGAALDITTTEDGGLLLSKHLPSCNICGGTQGVVKFKGFDICRECRQGLREVAGDD